MMLESLEYHFGKVTALPHTIQWLSDNGPCYVAIKTVAFARQLGFDVRTTPAYSPESNGMAEAFVKTFKRDYIAFSDPANAQAIMKQLHVWFEDYNENAPHKGLRMMTQDNLSGVLQGNKWSGFIGATPLRMLLDMIFSSMS